MQPSPPHGTRFRVIQPLRAIKLHPEADRTLDNQGFLTQIPAGEILEVDGRKRISGMRNVIWNAEFYALFEEDLLTQCEQLPPAP
ncbi:MAG: hypothetical protein ACR2NN_20355 [Bryobacteraceae bacterium]